MKPVMQPSREAASPRAMDRVLYPGKVVRIAGGHGGILRRREGELWITFEASGSPRHQDGRDHFLGRGQGLVVEPGEVIVVGAADPRRGMASFDWLPNPAPAPMPPAGVRAWFARLLPSGLAPARLLAA